MPITEKQLQERDEWIGSSEVAALLDENPWLTAYDVWLRKTDKLLADESKGGEVPEAAAIGTMLEEGLIGWAETQLSTKLNRNWVARKDACRLRCNIDAIRADNDVPVEAKTSGIVGPLYREWGEPGSDEIPTMHIIQCHAHMIVMDRPECHLPALLGGRGRQMFHVELNDDLAETIQEVCYEFWHQNVLRDIPPADTRPTLSVIKKIKTISGSVVPVHHETVQRWQHLSEMASGIKKAQEAAEELLRLELGQAEIGDVGINGHITNFEQKGGYAANFDALKADKLFKKYVRQVEYRRLRYRKEPLEGGETV